MFRHIGLLLLVLLGAPLFAQDTLVAPPTAKVEARSFDKERIAALKADPTYNYDSDLHYVPSPWERFKDWLAEWLERILGSRAGGFVLENLIIIISVVVVIIAVVILSRRGGLRRVFHGAPRSLGEVLTVDEDIRGMDLPALIREAELAGDLRRAIRLHYLLVLRKLVDQGVLKWSPEHTDRDYMAQIKEPALRSRFAHVALVFQWVWYGHAEVDTERYGSIKRPFVEFEEAPVR